jgi:hypothetical protein
VLTLIARLKLQSLERGQVAFGRDWPPLEKLHACVVVVNKEVSIAGGKKLGMDRIGEPREHHALL